VSYRCGRFYIYITFRRDVVPREPQVVMGVDINFNNVTYTIVDLGGNLISMGVVPFRGLKRALHLKKLAEGLQRRYPRSWRFLKWVRWVRARWLSRARSILVSWVRWSPDSPAGEGMRNRPNAGNPEAELTIGIYRITSGKPTPQLLR